jgi:hypothetical protein
MNYSETHRHLIALVLGCCCLVASEGALAAEAKRSEERRVPARQLAQLTVENPAGSIELQGEAREDLELTVQYRVWGGSADAVRKIIAALRIEVLEQDGRLLLRPMHAERSIDGPRPSWLDGARLSIDLHVRTPATLPIAASVTRDRLVAVDCRGDLILAATSGDVEVRQLDGALEAGVTSGTLRVSDVKGDVELTATSGDLDLRRVEGSGVLHSVTGSMRVEQVAGNLEIESTGGELVVAAVGGRLELISGSGDVAIREPGGDLKVNCASGDLSVLDLGPTTGGRPREVFLASSSGDVDVLVLPGAGYQLDVATDLGTMQLRLPLQVEDLTRRHVSGRFGDGKGRLRVVTATGDIRITLANETPRTRP